MKWEYVTAGFIATLFFTFLICIAYFDHVQRMACFEVKKTQPTVECRR